MLHRFIDIFAKRRKGFIPLLLAFLLALSSMCSASAQEVLLYNEKDVFPVTGGATYEGITLFTSLGWQKIHLLKVDLTSENIELDVINGTQGLSQRQSLSKIVTENGAIAGINGDFFIMATPSSPIGIQVSQGKLVSSPGNRSDMAAFGLTFDKIPQILRLQFYGQVVAPNGSTSEIAGINKIGAGYEKIYVYTPDFGKTTPTIPTSIPSLTFAVCRGDQIISIQEGKTIDIPEDGYILAARGAGGEFLKNNFTSGDPVTLNLNINPDISNLKMALGGGAVLVENGQIPASFSHDIPGKNPRTAIGFTQDKKTMILAVVDGRQNESRGMTQREMAELMRNHGASFALNLDGGGSSTMVTRPFYEKEPKVINSVSGGVQRLISNAIGIFAKAPKGNVHGLKIVANSFNIPKSGHRSFEVQAYDQNYNLIDINQEDVKWSVSDNIGAFDKNMLIAQNSGYGKVTATYNDIQATCDIYVLQEAAALSISPDKVHIAPGENKDLEVFVTDVKGFKAPLESVDIQWQVVGDIGNITGNRLTASNQTAAGAVIASFGDLKTSAILQVGLNDKTLDDSHFYNIRTEIARNLNYPVLPSLIVDKSNKPVTGNGLTFGVFGNLHYSVPYNSIYKKTLNLAAANMNKYKPKMNVIAGSVFAGAKVDDLALQNTLKNYKAAGNGYSVLWEDDATFIFLDASKGSIRLTNYNQWIRLQQDLEKAPVNRTMFLVLDRAPENFTDPLEKELLNKILAKYAKDKKLDIWMLHGGTDRFNAKVENGVHSISIPGVNAKEPAACVFNIQGGNVSYRVTPIIEKITFETLAIRKGTTTKLGIYGITPNNTKILLSYPYAVDWKLSSSKFGTVDPNIPAFNAVSAGDVEITVSSGNISTKTTLHIIDLTVKVNNKEIQFPDQNPYINKEQRTMVPVRFISEGLGAEVKWDNATRTVIIKSQDKIINLTIGESKALVNGNSIAFDTKAEIKNGRTMVPLRFVSEVLGAEVKWDNENRTVEINR